MFVHGTSANAAGWPTAITALQATLADYDLPNGAGPLQGTIAGLNSVQEAFLHTFNYGDPPGSSTHNRQAFDHIEWNAWESDKNGRVFTNVYLKPTDTSYVQNTPGPSDNRLTRQANK